MTYLVERLAELRKHLDHLRGLEPRVEGPESLRRDLSLHNDVMFSLLTVAQLVIDISGELGARAGSASRTTRRPYGVSRPTRSSRRNSSPGSPASRGSATS